MSQVKEYNTKKSLTKVLRTATGNCIVDFDVVQFREYGLEIKMSKTSCQEGVQAVTRIEETNSSMGSKLDESSISKEITPVDKASSGTLLKTSSGNPILDYDVVQFREYGLEIQTVRS